MSGHEDLPVETRVAALETAVIELQQLVLSLEDELAHGAA